MTPHLDAVALLPEIALTATLVLVFLCDLVITGAERHRRLLTVLAGVGTAAALVATAVLFAAERHASMAGDSFVVDDFALLAKAVLLAVTLIVLLLGSPQQWKGEYLLLVLSSTLGGLLVVSSRELITFIVAFELLAVPGYLLTGWRKKQASGHEAALKFYLLGMVATGVMLYGASLVFGLAGSTKFDVISQEFASETGKSSLAVIAVLFLLIGMAFKFSAVPLHFWAPDAYQGAPLPVAAFLSVVSKAAGLFAFAEITLIALGGASEIWAPALMAMAIATMTFGNVVALRQVDFVRLLAYSSIAQTGYALVPIAVAIHYGGTTALAIESLFEFLAIFAVMNLAAFAVVIAIGKTKIDDFTGLFHTHPWHATVLSIALLSLAGIPPFGGWFAKVVVFRAGIEASTTAAIVLVIVVALNTAIGLFYYARVIAQMWRPVQTSAVVKSSLHLSAAIASTAVLTLVIGVFPGLITDLGELVTFAS